METITFRHPRPKHSTKLSLEYQSNKSKRTKRKIKSLFINHYINNNFTYCGKPISFDEFVNLTGISNQALTNSLVTTFKQSNLLNGDNLQALAQGIGFSALKISEARLSLSQAIVSQLAARLLNRLSLGPDVREPIPLINSLSKHFDNSNSTTKTIVELIATLTKTPAVIINQNNDNRTNQNILTTERAYELLQEAETGGALLPEHLKPLVLQAHSLENLEEIRANSGELALIGVGSKISKPNEALLKEDEWSVISTKILKEKKKLNDGE